MGTDSLGPASWVLMRRSEASFIHMLHTYSAAELAEKDSEIWQKNVMAERWLRERRRVRHRAYGGYLVGSARGVGVRAHDRFVLDSHLQILRELIGFPSRATPQTPLGVACL